MKQKTAKKPAPAPAPGSPSWFKQALLGLYGIVGVSLSTFGGFKVPFAEANAKEYWRHALAGIVLVIGLMAGIVSLALYLFNANYFKSQIIDYVKTANQRDLTLDGDLKVTFFPKLALDAGKMTLSQRNSNRNFASIESGHFHIAWWPLFLKQLQIESVALNGVHANVVRYKNGTTNLDDFFAAEGSISDIKFEIDSIKFSNSSVSLQDETSGYFVSLHDVNLETGKLAENLPADISANFRLESAKPRIDTQVKLSSHLLFDLKAANYELANLEGEMAGDMAGINNLTLGFQGTLKRNGKLEQVTIDKIALNAKGKLDTRKLDARLDLAALTLNKNAISGSNLAFNGTLLQDDENLNAGLEAPAFELKDNMLKADIVSGNMDWFKSGRALQGKFSSPLSFDMQSRKLELGALNGNVNLSHPGLSGKLAGNLAGSFSADFAQQKLQLAYKTKVDDSNLNGNLSLQNFAQPEYALELSADKLDIDRYLVTDWAKRLQDDAAAFDFSALKNVQLRGKFRAGECKFARVKTSSLSGEFRIDQSALSVEPVTAKLYGGSFSGSLGIDAKAQPVISLKQKLNNVQFNTLLADYSGSDARISGRGAFNLEVSGSGDSLGALRKSLNGNASVQLYHGALSGINLGDRLLANRQQLGVKDATYSGSANFAESSAFSELKSAFDIAGGVARSSSFLLKAPQYTVSGSGEIALDSRQLTFQLNTAIPASLKRGSGELAELKGMNIPLHVSGPYSAPAYTLELGAASGGKPAKPARPEAGKATPAAGAARKQGSGK